jgi:hypothetical protein
MDSDKAMLFFAQSGEIHTGTYETVDCHAIMRLFFMALLLIVLLPAVMVVAVLVRVRPLATGTTGTTATQPRRWLMLRLHFSFSHKL